MRVRDSVTAIAGLAAVAVSMFVVGAVLRWTQALVALLVAVSLGGFLISRRGFARLSPLIALLGSAMLLTAIQLLPLPDALLGILTPSGSALREDGTTLLDVAAASTITIDVPATLRALVFFAVLLGLALVALRMSTSEKGRYRVIASVAALCGLTAIVVGIHELFDIRNLYGVYEPRYATPALLGPLLNGNSLACLMAFGAVLAIGLAAHRRQAGWVRALWLLVVAGCGTIAVATVSRGATLAFAGGGLIAIVILIGQRLVGQEASRRRRIRFLANALPIGVVGGCMVVLVIWSNAATVEHQLSELSIDELQQTRSKFAAWKSAGTLIEEAPLLGVGRGAFESAFTRVHPASGLATYTHLENEYLQVVVDWGLLGAIALGTAALWLAVVAVKRWRDGALAAGALGAIGVVAMQSNVDFGLEFLGLAAPVTVVAATLTYVPLREISRVSLVRAARVAHVLGLLVGGALLLSSATTTLEEDQRALREQPSLAATRASAERHPLDYYSYAVTADILARAGDPRAIRVLNHAMLLHPTHPGLHRMAARMLYRQGFIGQSALEYAAALRSTTEPAKLIAEIVARYSPDQAATALPLDYPELEQVVHTLSELGRTDVATLWLSMILDRQANHARACEQLFAIAQKNNLEAAQVASRRCREMLPDYQTRVALARELANQRAHRELFDLLHDVESWQSRVDDKITAWLALCDAHTALGAVDEAKRCLRRLDASPDMRMERRNEILQRLEAMQKPPELLVPPATGSAAASP